MADISIFINPLIPQLKINKYKMKTLLTIAVIILSLMKPVYCQVPFSGTSGNFTTDSKPPVVTLLSPDGGESYFVTDPLPVNWTATDDGLNASPITIQVSTNGGASYSTVATGLSNTSPANVTPPLFLTSQAKVKVIAQDLFGLTGYDESANVFSLQGIIVNLKAYLESPILPDSSMRTDLNSGGYIPLAQPYNQPPWNYNGTENVLTIPNSEVVDWVLVEIRETGGDASTAYSDNVIARRAGFLLKKGTITSTDGISPLIFNVTSSQNLFAVVSQRNHIPVLSSNPLVLNNGKYTYNFSDNENKAFGGALAHKQIDLGIWAMPAGDGNANGTIDANDKDVVWKSQGGKSGYIAADYSLNGQANNVDKNDYWRINNGRTSQTTGDWTCGLPIADPRDGKTYSTVQIGTQCWMARNLNVGSMIPYTQEMANNGTVEKYCYNNNAANCDIYGGLYQWNEIMNYSTTQGIAGICPSVTGWHLPTDPELTLLSSYLGGDNIAGGKLKETGTVHWNSPNTGATNESGYIGLPGGYRINYGSLGTIEIGNAGSFWSSSEFSTNNARMRFLSYNSIIFTRSSQSKTYGYSVRCVKGDYVNQPPFQPTNPSPANGAVNQWINPTLSWNVSDPDEDPLTYDVYFGMSNPPSIVSSGQSANTYLTGALSLNTPYYWNIIVHDNHGNSTVGVVWTFTTQCQLPPNAGPDQLNVLGVTTTLQGSTPTIGTGTWYISSGTGGIIAQPNNPVSLFTGISGNSYILVWAFSDPCGTSYDNVTISFSANFTCGYTFLDTRDNKVYNTVQIGSQCWMKQNLNYATGNSACYGGNPINCDNYGRLYDYNTASSACPTGWHLPSDNEWCILTTFVDPTVGCLTPGISGTDAGGKMKETGTTYWAPPNTGATNSSGFSARGAGSSFSTLLTRACFWSTTDYTGGKWSREIFYNDARIWRTVYGTSNQLSVRCIKN
jgi:uncharacterized protein (TIGR02145 family)